MRKLHLRRVLRSGYTNFKRNGIVSFASIVVMTVTLSVIAAIFFVQAVLSKSLTEVKERVDITVTFVTTASEESILAVKATIEQVPEVASVTYETASERLAAFRLNHQNDALTLQALSELGDTNPLGAVLKIKARDTNQYESIAKLFDADSVLVKNSISIIEKVSFNQNRAIIDALNDTIANVDRLSALVTLVLILLSVIVTFNTIRLTIHFAREEIGIMRLVGAEKSYVRGPFLVEGMLYGVYATLLALFLYLPITYWFGKNMTGFLGLNLFSFFWSNILKLTLILLASGIGLGVISSILATRKYLNK